MYNYFVQLFNLLIALPMKRAKIDVQKCFTVITPKSHNLTILPCPEAAMLAWWALCAMWCIVEDSPGRLGLRPSCACAPGGDMIWDVWGGGVGVWEGVRAPGGRARGTAVCWGMSRGVPPGPAPATGLPNNWAEEINGNRGLEWWHIMCGNMVTWKMIRKSG